MRISAILVLVIVASLIVIAGAALAAEPAPATAPTGWAAVETAVIGVALVVLAWLSRRLPALMDAGIGWLTEWATSARVARVDAAIDTALAAGASPAEAAEIVAAKLPDTLKRSRKDKFDIREEARVKEAAQRPPATPR